MHDDLQSAGKYKDKTLGQDIKKTTVSNQERELHNILRIQKK